MKSTLHAHELCRPLPLAAVALLVVNDHLLKGAEVLPGPVVGKLSDVAGLFLAPILIVVVMRIGWATLSRRDFAGRLAAWSAALVCGAVFGAIKLSAVVNAWANMVWGEFVMDPTDLVCLPMSLLAVAWLGAFRQRDSRQRDSRQRDSRQGNGRHPRRLAQFGAVMLAAGATMASPMPPRRQFPHWQLHQPTRLTLDGLNLQAWDAQSGKSGLGVMVRAKNPTDTAHSVNVVGARLELFGDDPDRIIQTIEGRAGPSSQSQATPVQPGQTDDVYVYFEFDNQQAWNRHIRHGYLTVDVQVDQRPATPWRMPAAHVLPEHFSPDYLRDPPRGKTGWARRQVRKRRRCSASSRGYPRPQGVGHDRRIVQPVTHPAGLSYIIRVSRVDTDQPRAGKAGGADTTGADTTGADTTGADP